MLADRSAAPTPRLTRDGSFSLYSPAFGEGFHCADGALSEARRVFVAPAQLERLAAGGTLRVLEVAVGTGTNTAALLQACQQRGLHLDWWGLELDPRPLRLALADQGFRRQWPSPVLAQLEPLVGGERLLWGDGRDQLPRLQQRLAGRCDLVLHDGFSPRHCPQLWSLEFLADLAALLAPRGRLLTYCSAAAVRRALQLCDLQLAAIRGCEPALVTAAAPAFAGAEPGSRALGPVALEPTARARGPSPAVWSAGTVASPSALPLGGVLRPLSSMEREHLACRAGEPYRDPERNGKAATLLEQRQQQQNLSAAESSGQWQRRWGLARRHGEAPLGSVPLGSPPQLGALPLEQERDRQPAGQADRQPAGQAARDRGPGDQPAMAQDPDRQGEAGRPR